MSALYDFFSSSIHLLHRISQYLPLQICWRKGCLRMIPTTRSQTLSQPTWFPSLEPCLLPLAWPGEPVSILLDHCHLCVPPVKWNIGGGATRRREARVRARGLASVSASCNHLCTGGQPGAPHLCDWESGLNRPPSSSNLFGNMETVLSALLPG